MIWQLRQVKSVMQARDSRLQERLRLAKSRLPD